MRPTMWTAGVSVAILAATLSMATAEEVFRDNLGVWRTVPAPGWSAWPDPVPEDYIPPRPVIRGSPEDLLRALVPSYDDPEWQEDGGRVLRYHGPVDDPYGVGPGSIPPYGEEPLYSPGDPQQAEIGLPGRSAAIDAANISDGLARYAAAKRKAMADADPATRLSGIRSANAYLVTLAYGDLTVAAIQGIDGLIGLAPVTADSVRLPGAGTEVHAPDARPTGADRDGARRIVDYALLRNQGESAEDAARQVLGDKAVLTGSAVAGLDAFLGLDGGIAVTIR